MLNAPWPNFAHIFRTAPKKRLGRQPSYARPVAIAKRTERPGVPWYLVVILKDDGCGGVKFLNHVVAAGWVPFYNKEGLNNLWFSPRGC